MKIPSLYLSLLLGLLAGCTSPTEKQGLDAVAQFYGDKVSYSKGSHLSTNAAEPQGKYLEVKVFNTKLSKEFSDLRLPASNCAYLTYSSLAPAERQAYNYVKVTLQDSLTEHSYTFKAPELALATQAATDLDRLMTHFKDRDYNGVVNSFNPATLPPDVRANLPTSLAELEKKTGPVTQYYLQGYALTSAPVAGRSQQLVRLFVTVQRAQKAGKLLAVINPQLRPNEKFLYGLNILD
ncbi:hypothetical protein GO988_12325 [Hymenobacter sp. HMF4947]|uniref:Uncharacterized protein n=1 Tax=Hymenobacter ginkgonis TaxID=2682976 RepID=A0A7K1TFC2_9BACT|nr:hypothetical protein [Hymenobacter ginkgonis]MVN77113.1 hypothetical protein [Hymenobacter ginkgonis]